MNGSRPCVLVIDDESGVRNLVRSILGEAGFAVSTATDGEAALARIAGAPFDLAIVDLGLPGALDGHETMRRARLRHPDLKALFMSSTGGPPPHPDLARDDIVYKPFASREFLGCVFELLLRDGERTEDSSGTAHGHGHRLAAELGLAEARRSCLRRRRVAALRAGDHGLAAELARDLDGAVVASPPTGYMRGW